MHHLVTGGSSYQALPSKIQIFFSKHSSFCQSGTVIPWPNVLYPFLVVYSCIVVEDARVAQLKFKGCCYLQ